MTARREPASALEGVVPVDKPTGMTSHDVVDRIRRVAGTRRVGHTGTLDPMADGLLLVCIGGATRIARFLAAQDKTYAGTIVLGAISSTYDAEGELSPQGRPLPADATAVREAMRALTGERAQLPPPYSAVKVRGRKLYEYARAGEEAPLRPRPVRIERFELVRYEPPEVHFEARVSSGVYVRSMAHDLGLALGCGGYLSRLRRTRIGAMSVEHAVPLETLLAEPELLPERLLGIGEALSHLPKVVVHPAVQQAVCHGRSFTVRDVIECEGLPPAGVPLLVLDARGQVLSIAEAVPGEDGPGPGPSMVFKPLRVLAEP